MTQTRSSAVAAPASTLRLVQAGAALSVLVLLWQFITAGRLVTLGEALGGHQAGAIGLHVATGILLLGAALYGRTTRVWWPAALAAVTFLLTFLQAYLGSHDGIDLHVPLAMLLTVGVVWLASWAFRSTVR
jgi:hypothetical protein